MNEFSKNLKQNLKPPYVDKFELSHHPFTPQFNSTLFYKTEGREVILKKLSHLIDFTNFILFLQGAKGLGKSTLIRQRIREAKETWRTCFINAKDFTNPLLLIEKIATDMKIKLHQKIEIPALQEQLDAMRQTGLTPVLFIDDIEEINSAIIPIINALIQHDKNNHPNLRLIIAGQDIGDEVIAIIPKDDDKSTLKYLPIPPLSELETTDYIKHRLQVSNYQYTDPFNKKCLAKIYLESKGFPAKINSISDHIFSLYTLEYDNKKPLIHLNKNTNRALKYTAIGLCLLIAVFVAISQISSPPENIEITNTTKTNTLEIPDIKNIQVNKATPPEKKLGMEIGLESQPTPKNISPETDNLKITKNEPEINSLSKTIKPTASPEIVEPEPPKEQKLIKPEESVTTNTVKQVRSIKQSHAWVKRQPSKNYTLQLLGGVNKSSIIDFVKKHQLEKDAAIIHSIHKGRDWYSVLYRSFSTEKLAKQGVKLLPPSLKRIKPWVRPFSVIQKNMR